LRFCPNFRQIKTFGGTLTPPAPATPLVTTWKCTQCFQYV